MVEGLAKRMDSTPWSTGRPSIIATLPKECRPAKDHLIFNLAIHERMIRQRIYTTSGTEFKQDCPKGYKVIGGGCSRFSSQRDNGPNGALQWKCGNTHSDVKKSWAICSSELDPQIVQQSAKSTLFVQARCADGMKLIGGGCRTAAGKLRYSGPDETNPEVWKCGGHDGNKVSTAICSSKITPRIEVATGGDVTTVMCKHGFKVLSGGCDAFEAPLAFTYSAPINDTGWKCGGKGGGKKVWAMCADVDTGPELPHDELLSRLDVMKNGDIVWKGGGDPKQNGVIYLTGISFTVQYVKDDSYERARGATGAIGPPGPLGFKGHKGDQGHMGLQGKQGEPGKHGTDGRDGINGKDGLQGFRGLSGNQGFAGLIGDPGMVGIMGPDGWRGPPGLHAHPLAPIDCVWNAWLPWEQCPVTCGGAMQMRERWIKVHSQNGGKPCGGTFSSLRKCSMNPCGIGADARVLVAKSKNKKNSKQKKKQPVARGDLFSDAGKGESGARRREASPLLATSLCLAAALAAVGGATASSQ
jgi:hypothetical protein